ncbi:hypothetical protein LOH53_13670 [Arthrobacter cryoconiti]|nr:hypothetical protein [Arthrobacter cryoconiti]
MGRFAKPRRRATTVQLPDGGGGTTAGALVHLGVKPAQHTTAAMAARWAGRAGPSPESDS